MNISEEWMDLASSPEHLTLGRVGRAIHEAHQLEAEAFGDAVMAIPHVPVVEAATWYGDTLRSGVELPIVTPPAADMVVFVVSPPQPDRFEAHVFGLLY